MVMINRYYMKMSRHSRWEPIVLNLFNAATRFGVCGHRRVIF